MLIQAVLFDYNGTCLDDLALGYRSVRETFRHHNILPIPTQEQFQADITSSYMDFYHKYGFPRNLGPDDVNAVRNKFYTEHASEAKLRQDLAGTALSLRVRKIRVGIVSAETESLLERRLKKAGIMNLFDPIKGNCRDKEKALFKTAIELGMSPEGIIYVDDSEDGCRAALRLGMISVGFGRGYHPPGRLQKYSLYLINELAEVLPIVDLLEKVGGQHGK